MNSPDTLVAPVSHTRDSSVAPALTQMAIDSYLLSQASRINQIIFRVYKMSPPAVTIGRHQRWQRVVDESICLARGWEWVRRPTGGGALLHCDEINYAVIVPRGVLTPCGEGEFRRAFSIIGETLSACLREFGFKPELQTDRCGDAVSQHGLCGRSITGHEITLAGRKIVAAAQLIEQSGILQHGTVYLKAPSADDRFWPTGGIEDSMTDSLQRWADLGPELAERQWFEVASVLESAFRRHLPDDCIRVELAESDWVRIERIAGDWTARGWNRVR